MTGGMEVGVESWWGKRKGRRRREPRCGGKDEREGRAKGGRAAGEKGSVRGVKLGIQRRAVKGECVPNTAVLVPQGTQTLP